MLSNRIQGGFITSIDCTMPQPTEGSRIAEEQRPSRTVSRRENQSRRRTEASPVRSGDRNSRRDNHPRGSRRNDNERYSGRRSRSRERSATRRHSRRRSERRSPDQSRRGNRLRDLVSRSRIDDRYDYRRSMRRHIQDNQWGRPRRSSAQRNSRYRDNSRGRGREENPFLRQN